MVLRLCAAATGLQQACLGFGTANGVAGVLCYDLRYFLFLAREIQSTLTASLHFCIAERSNSLCPLLHHARVLIPHQHQIRVQSSGTRVMIAHYGALLHT